MRLLVGLRAFCLVCPEQTSHTLLVKARIKEILLRNRAKVPADQLCNSARFQNLCCASTEDINPTEVSRNIRVSRPGLARLLLANSKIYCKNSKTKVPPHENKSCKSEERKWKSCLQRPRTVCEKARRTFKASENVRL